MILRALRASAPYLLPAVALLLAAVLFDGFMYLVSH